MSEADSHSRVPSSSVAGSHAIAAPVPLLALAASPVLPVVGARSENRAAKAAAALVLATARGRTPK